MFGFVRAGISLAIVRSNSLLLRGPHDKGARIRQRPDLTDGAVMALPAPWRSSIYEILRGGTVEEYIKDSDMVRGSSRRISR